MKKTIKVLALILSLVLISTSLTGCAKIGYVVNGTIDAISSVKSGEWKQTDAEENAIADNEIKIDTFEAGTYASKKFETQEDAVNYYIECYNNTKAQTATYTDKDGNSYEYYALVGEETLSVDNILINGSKNDMLNNTVPGIVKSAFAKGIYGLPPSNNRDPKLDNINMDANDPGEYDYRTSYFKPEYCLACNVVDNNDGTITMTIQPKDASMSARGADSQGSFFEVLKDLGETVDNLFNDYDMLSWASGSTADNCVVDYKGGTGKITIDTKTDTVIEADYDMCVYVEVKHANISVIKDKSGALFITHHIHYPASDSYLMESKGLTKK